MKKIGFLVLSLFLPQILLAEQLVPNGYYRAKNSDTGRYITVIDGYGKIDYQSTSVDLGAIQTEKNFDAKVCSNPASVIYIEYNQPNDGYTFFCQGTNTFKITGVYLKVRERSGKYWLYATKSGSTLYLSDKTNQGKDSSTVVTDESNTKNWETVPLTTTGDAYFGMKPTITYQSANYLSFFAGFPFSFYSEGMEAYYVKSIDTQWRVAIWEKWTQTDVPASMPIIVKCKNSAATDNRLDIHTSTVSAPTTNLLQGVYFLRNRQQIDNPHRAVTENDTATMRVLGLLTDGSLGMKKYTGKFIPKNTAYLKVNAGSPDELKLMTAAEFEEYKRIVSVESLSSTRTNDIIYDLTGQRVKVNSRAALTKGIYIVNGKKVVVKQ